MALRNREENKNLPPSYEEESNLFTLKLHHGGTIRNDPFPEYIGGQISVFDDVDGDGFSIDEMTNLVEDIEIFEKNRFCVLAEEHGFHEVISNREFDDMVVDALNNFREVELYLLDPSDHTDVRPPKCFNDDEYISSDDETYVCSQLGESDGSGCEEWSDLDSDYLNDEEVGSPKMKEMKSNLSKKQSAVSNFDPNRDASDSDNVNERDEAPDSEDELESIKGSDNDEDRTLTVFNPKNMWKPELKCGMQFSSFKEFKEAVRTWNIVNGRPWKFVRNDKLRVKAICPVKTKIFSCDWQVTARNMGDDGTGQIRSFKEKHKCGFKYKNGSVKSNWVAKKYTEIIRENPKLDNKSFRDRVMKENRCFISKNQGYRAKRKAMRIIQGSEIDQYSLLHAYSAEFLKTNPGSTVVMKMVDGFKDRETGNPRFERIYICFAGVKEGFLAGCRKLIGLDGTFLKGPCGEVLLTAIGIDPNNRLYPIAYAVVEGENNDSWSWFLCSLRDDLHIQLDEEWTLMSDKQKGLIQASATVFPLAEHRFCVKHLHGNFSGAGFKGKALRKALWAAAKASTVPQLNEEAAKWLEDKPPSEWSRSHFRVELKCDMLLNNHCESFNGKILEHRENAIVDMLEGFRIYMMERMQENRDRAMLQWVEKAVCPNIFKQVQENCTKAALCVPHKSDNANVEVWYEYGFKFAVNIKDRTCTCRKWDLTGIPCAHAISALWILNEEPLEYVDVLYSVETYLKCYSHAIFPINGQHEWTTPNLAPPLPPLYGRAPGRPKKNRRKGELEIRETKEKNKKVSRAGLKGKCTFCGEVGHNRRTCKGWTVISDDSESENEQEQMPENELQSQLTQENLKVHIEFGSEEVYDKINTAVLQELHPELEISTSKHQFKKPRKSTDSTVNAIEKGGAYFSSQMPQPSTTLPTRTEKNVVEVTSTTTQNINVNVAVQVCDSTVNVSRQSTQAEKVDKVDKASFNEMSTNDKYELFGLVPPPFPIGTKPNLQNVKKVVNHQNADQTKRSESYIAGMRNAYEAIGIQLPEVGSSKSSRPSVYELFGIPVAAFLGGSDTNELVNASTSSKKANANANIKKK